MCVKQTLIDKKIVKDTEGAGSVRDRPDAYLSKMDLVVLVRIWLVLSQAVNRSSSPTSTAISTQHHITSAYDLHITSHQTSDSDR